MRKKKEPWPDYVHFDKDPLRPYVRFSEFVKSDQYKEQMELWRINKHKVFPRKRQTDPNSQS